MEENPHVTIIGAMVRPRHWLVFGAQSQAGNVTWDLVDMLPSDAQPRLRRRYHC